MIFWSVWSTSWNLTFRLSIILQLCTREICYSLKRWPTLQHFLLSFLFVHIKLLRLNNLKAEKAMNAKFSGFPIYVKAVIYLLLYSLHDCISKSRSYPLLNLRHPIQKQWHKGKWRLLHQIFEFTKNACSQENDSVKIIFHNKTKLSQ